MDENTLQLLLRDGATPVTIGHRDGERLRRALHQLLSRHEFTQSQQRSGAQHSKIRAKDVPGTLLNIVRLFARVVCYAPDGLNYGPHFGKVARLFGLP